MPFDLCCASRMNMKRTMGFKPVERGELAHTTPRPPGPNRAFHRDQDGQPLLSERDGTGESDPDAVETLRVTAITIAAGIEFETKRSGRDGGVSHLLEEG